MSTFPGGMLLIQLRVDGAIMMKFNREVIVLSPQNAVEIAKALIKVVGGEIVIAEPGQTVIRPPRTVVS